MLIGDRRKFLSCLVTLKVEVRLSWFNFCELELEDYYLPAVIFVYNEDLLAMLLARLLASAVLLVQIPDISFLSLVLQAVGL